MNHGGDYQLSLKAFISYEKNARAFNSCFLLTVDGGEGGETNL